MRKSRTFSDLLLFFFLSMFLFGQYFDLIFFLSAFFSIDILVWEGRERFFLHFWLILGFFNFFLFLFFHFISVKGRCKLFCAQTSLTQKTLGHGLPSEGPFAQDHPVCCVVLWCVGAVCVHNLRGHLPPPPDPPPPLFFFLLPPQFSFFLPLSLCLLRLWGPPGLHTTPRELQTYTFDVPGLQITPPKFHETTPNDGRGKKSAKFWGPHPSGAQNSTSKNWPKSKLAELEKKKLALFWTPTFLPPPDRPKFRPFFHLPKHNFLPFFPLLGVLSWNFGSRAVV